MTLFRSLSVRPFALLLAGQALSRIGDHIYQVVLAWWVLEKTGSALAMGTVLILAVIPELLFGLVGGVTVDRLPRVPLLLVTEVVRGLAITAAAVMSYNGTLELWPIYVFSFLSGVADAFFQPAYTALVPDIVAPEDLPSANSLSSMSTQFGRIIGPPLAAALISVGGTSLGLLLNGLSFFASAALMLPLLTMIRESERREVAGHHSPATVSPLTTLWADLRAGFAIVVAKPILWVGILAMALTNVFLAGPYSVSLPFLVEARFSANVNALGFLYALFPAGYVLGGVWLGRKSVLRWRGRLIFIGLGTAGFCLAFFGLPLPLVALGLAAFINGAALEATGLTWVTTLQQEVPDEALGRVASIDILGSTALLPVGFILAGWATDAFGPAAVFALGGSLTVLVALLALAYPAVRRFD